MDSKIQIARKDFLEALKSFKKLCKPGPGEEDLRKVVDECQLRKFGKD